MVGPPPLMPGGVGVTFRFGDYLAGAVRADVTGPDKPNVIGLADGIKEVFTRSASGPTKVPSIHGWIAVAPGWSLGALLGFLAVRAFNLAPVDNRSAALRDLFSRR